jgi:hypothetical protein
MTYKTATPPPSDRFQFSLLHFIYAIALIAFGLAAARKDRYEFQSILNAICVGILLYGITLQIFDLWKARSAWIDANIQEKNGWRLAIVARIAILLGLTWTLLKPETNFIQSSNLPPGLEEFLSYMTLYQEFVPPLVLVFALSLAPCFWREKPNPASWRSLSRLIQVAILAIVATVAWHEYSYFLSLIHIAIQGVALNQSISTSAQPTAIPSPTPQALAAGAQIAYSAIACSLAAIMFFANSFVNGQSRSQSALRWLMRVTAILALGGSAYAILLLYKIYVPESSPLIVTETAYAHPARIVAIIVGALLSGGAFAYWRQRRRTAPVWRHWRRDFYPHETRLFLEVFLFAQILQQLPFWTSVAKGCFEFITFQFTADKWRSLWWPIIATIAHSGIQFAPFLLALSGLLHHQLQATSSSEETPSPFSIIRFLLETFFWAAAAYCLAESIIWSGFYYHITPGR